MTVFENRQKKLDHATQVAIKARGIVRSLLVLRLRLTQWQMQKFLENTTVLEAERNI